MVTGGEARRLEIKIHILVEKFQGTVKKKNRERERERRQT